MTLHQIIQALANEPSTNKKLEILKAHQDNELLKNYFKLALDPTINYFIKVNSLPPSNGTNADLTLDDIQAVYIHLAKRQITGNSAREYVNQILANLNPDSQILLMNMINRDPKCNVGESLSNKCWKGLIPEYPYMRCCLLKDVKIENFNWKNGVLSQLKADGMFCNVSKDPDGNVQLMSRNGSVFDITKFSQIVGHINRCIRSDTVTHGELLVKRDGTVLPREIGNGILNSVLKGGSFEWNDEPHLVVWDQIPLSASVPGGSYNVPYYDRGYDLQCQILDSDIDFIESKPVFSFEQAIDHYQEVILRGQEGTIFKDPDAIWKDTTSKQQVKLKIEVDVDLKIIGFTEGKGKNASTFGSVTTMTDDGLLEVNVSGFKDKAQKGIMTRQQINEIRDDLIGTIMTVRSNGIMKPSKNNQQYSLFLPRFVEFRSDKTKADTLEQVIKQFDSVIKKSK